MAYASGRLVVLVLDVKRVDPAQDIRQHAGERIQARLVSRECNSAGQAKAIAARAIADLELFGATHKPHEVLDVSATYADAAYRRATRRRGFRCQE